MDEKLKAIVQRMIDAGESEANIARVIKAYVSSKPVKKKGEPVVSDGTSEGTGTSLVSEKPVSSAPGVSLDSQDNRYDPSVDFAALTASTSSGGPINWDSYREKPWDFITDYPGLKDKSKPSTYTPTSDISATNWQTSDGKDSQDHASDITSEAKSIPKTPISKNYKDIITTSSSGVVFGTEGDKSGKFIKKDGQWFERSTRKKLNQESADFIKKEVQIINGVYDPLSVEGVKQQRDILTGSLMKERDKPINDPEKIKALDRKHFFLDTESEEYRQQEDERLRRKKISSKVLELKNKITPTFISLDEDIAVPKLRKYLKDKGPVFDIFKVDYSGIGSDAMVITNKLTKENKTISLDNWSSDRNKVESKVLQGFIDYSIRTSGYGQAKSKVKYLESLLEKSKKDPGRKNEIELTISLQNAKKELKLADKERREIVRGNPTLEAAMYQSFDAKNITQEIDATMVVELELKRSTLEREEKIKEVVKAYDEGRITDDEWFSKWEPMLLSLESKNKSDIIEFVDNAEYLGQKEEDIKSSAGANYLQAKDRGSGMAAWGYSTAKILTNAMAGIKAIEGKSFDQARATLSLAPGVITQEYMESEDRSDVFKLTTSLYEFLGGTVLGTALTGNPVTGAFWNGFLTSAAGIGQEMNSDEFANIPKNERQLLALLSGTVGGFTNMVGVGAAMSKTPLGKMAQGRLNSFLIKTIREAPKGASPQLIEQMLKNNIKTNLASRVLTTGSAMVAEGTEEVVQGLSESSIREVYNAMKEKELFNTADGAEYFNQMAESFKFGVAGGLIFNVGSQAKGIYKNGFDDSDVGVMQYEILKDITTNPELNQLYQTNLKTQVDQGIITQEQAEIEKGIVTKMAGIMNKIPKAIDTQRQVRAFNLIKEKQKLEQDVKEKDPNLVVSENDRISEINKELQGLSITLAAKDIEVKNNNEIDNMSKEAAKFNKDKAEVERLRQEEQAELIEAIPNAENYLTDGKVDKEKITNPEDIAEFEKIYDKYDKVISPLLKPTQQTSEVDNQSKIDEINKKKEESKNNPVKEPKEYAKAVDDYKSTDLGSNEDAKNKKEAVVKQAQTKEGKEFVENQVAQMDYNEDGTITVYRSGTLQEGHNPATTNKQTAEIISSERKEQGLSSDIIEIKIQPSDISAVVPGVESEVLININKGNSDRIKKGTKKEQKNKEQLTLEKESVKNELEKTTQSLEKLKKDKLSGVFPFSDNLYKDTVKKQEAKIKNLEWQLKKYDAELASKVEAKEVQVISAENSSNFSNMTEDGDGNFVFYHYSTDPRETIDPKKYGSNKANLTSKAEKQAIAKVGGVSMFYTNKDTAEKGTGDHGHMVKIPKGKVYDMNNDYLNLKEQAKELHDKEHPGMGYDDNSEAAYVTKIAEQKGFEMLVAEWKGVTRAQTVTEKVPTQRSETKGDQIKKSFDNDYESNKQKGYAPVIPEGKKTKLDRIYKKINVIKNEAKEYDSLYRLNENSTKLSEAEITPMIMDSNLDQSIKDEYQEAVKYKPDPRRSVKKENIVSVHNENGGSSISQSGENLFGKPGYSVSTHTDKTTKVKGKNITQEDIDTYTEKYKGTLEKNKVLFVGTWYDTKTDTTYIDVVSHEKDLKTAIAMGIAANQKSIFDLENGVEIDTGGTGEVTNESETETKTAKKGADLLDKEFNKTADSTEVMDQVENAKKAIAKVSPKTKIVVHKTAADYKKSGKNRKQNEGGEYDVENDTIHINLESANKRTVAHEVFHALLLSKGMSNKKAEAITNKMLDVVKKTASPELLQTLEEFSSRYESTLQSEESIAELFGILASEYETLPRPTQNLIKRWLDKLAKLFGIKTFTDNEIVDLLNVVSAKVEAGQEITKQDVKILDGSVSGVINGQVRKQDSVLISFNLKRFPTNPNIKLSENTALSNFNQKKSNLLESDRMTGAFIADTLNNPVFKFFGGIYFPQITGKWWASRTLSKANSIAENMNANRDKDGYIYATPIIMKPNSHMSNQDMFETVWEFMKFDLRSKSSKVTKKLFGEYLTKALTLKSVNLTESDLNIKKSDNIETMITKLNKVLLGDDTTLSFEKRKAIIKAILGDPKVTEDRKFPTAGSISEVASKFEEEKTKQATKLWDVVMLMRTKGTLSTKVTPKSDEFYHKSYPAEISSDQEIEVFFLDGAYNIDTTYPELTQSSGKVFSWKEYSEKHPSAAMALSQYGRTAKLSKASGDIVAPQSRKQKPEGTPSIADVRAKAKEMGVDEDGVVAYLKRLGYTTAEINSEANSLRKKIKKAPSVKKLGLVPASKKITVSEKAALKTQIKLRAKAARDGAISEKKARQEIADMVKVEMELTKGKFSKRQVAAIVRRALRMNLSNDKQAGIFVDYVAKVVSDVDYLDKISKAKAIQKKISKNANKADLQSNLSVMGREFAKINPRMVKDIDQYNEMASKVNDSLMSSKRKGEEVIVRVTANQEEVTAYTDKMISKQEDLIKESLIQDYAELTDANVLNKDMSIAEMNDAIADILDSEVKPKIDVVKLRDNVKDKFTEFSEEAQEILDSGIDPITGEDLSLSKAQRDAVQTILNLNTDKLSVKELLGLIDMLTNFAVNRSTSKIIAIAKMYEGAENLDKALNKIPPATKRWRITRSYINNFGSISLLLENILGGPGNAIVFKRLSGFSEFSYGAIKGENASDTIEQNYIKEFKKKKANGEYFNTEKNTYERGMYAFLMRNKIGDSVDMRKEFNRRVELMKENIDYMTKEGTDEEQAQGAIYQQIAEKFGLFDQDVTMEDIDSRVDKVNKEAVGWWISEWENRKTEADAVAKDIYNRVLDSDINFTPDVFRTKGQVTMTEEQRMMERMADKRGKVYDKSAPSLMATSKPRILPPSMKIDLDFDNNNANRIKSSLIDIETAAATQKLKGFLESKNLSKLFPNKKDRDTIVEVIKNYIDDKRIGKKFVKKDETIKWIEEKILNPASEAGVKLVLASLQQIPKQSISVIANTILNTGRFDAGAMFSSTVKQWIKDNGMPLSKRGVESTSTIERADKYMKKYGGTRAEALQLLKKADDFYLKTFLLSTDVRVAQASFLSYYKKDLLRQGLRNVWGKADINYDAPMNEEAMDYAMQMVDKQQNISDPDMAGSFWNSQNTGTNFLKRTMFALASFSMNQHVRMYTDIKTITKKTQSGDQRVAAAKSLAGTAAEFYVYRALALSLGYAIKDWVNELVGYDELEDQYITKAVKKENNHRKLNGKPPMNDKQELKFRQNELKKNREKKYNQSILTAATKDFVSPMPFLDGTSIDIVNYFMEKSSDPYSKEINQDVSDENLKRKKPMNRKEEEAFRSEKLQEEAFQLYSMSGTDSWGNELGTAGIVIDKMIEGSDIYKASNTGVIEDYAGRKKYLLPKHQEAMKTVNKFNVGYFLRILPADIGTVTNNSYKKLRNMSFTKTEMDQYEILFRNMYYKKTNIPLELGSDKLKEKIKANPDLINLEAEKMLRSGVKANKTFMKVYGN